MRSSNSPDTALVLSGGVAYGAFEAGALQVVAEHGIPVSHVVGASSGALNAIEYAAAIHSGREREAVDRLLDLWREDADWKKAFHVTVLDALRGRGLSDSSRMFALMRRELPKMVTPALHPVRLHLVVAVMQGVATQLDGKPATTFEGVIEFRETDFDTDAGRERIYTAAAASSAFPLVFHPVSIDGLGPSYDGAIVNDTPIKWATSSGADRVIVIAPYPAAFRPTKIEHALDFVTHLADILTHERLFRDLHEAEKTNQQIADLRAMVRRKQLTAEQLELILRELEVKPIEVISIRPESPLQGSPFGGLFDSGLRESYILAGRQAALSVLSSGKI